MTDNSPELSGQRELSGHEPEISGARPKCTYCKQAMRRVVDTWKCNRWNCPAMRQWAANGVKPVRTRLESDPAWFNAATAYVGEQQIRHVRSGRHPMGSALLNEPDKTCSNCRFHWGNLYGRGFHKCGAPEHRITGGPATDIRVGWPACVLWQEKIEG